MRRPAKKFTVLVAGCTLSLSATAGAYAFWTTSGTGTGTASTASGVTALVSQSGSISGLAPGGPAQAVSFNIAAPASGAVTVSTVTVAVGTLPPGCVTGDFTVNNATYMLPTGPVTISAGNNQTFGGLSVPGSPSIQMNDTSANQNGCESQTDIPLTFTVS